MYETLMTMALEDDLDVAQCNADWCFRETGETWQSIPTDRLRSTGVLTGPDWLRMGLSSRRWTHVVWMGVYRRDVIVKNNIKFIAGLHHQDIVWTTEFMFNALRARYTEQSLYKYYLHNTSVSRLHRQGNKNLNYQRHYIKITRLVGEIKSKLCRQNYDLSGISSANNLRSIACLPCGAQRAGYYYPPTDDC